jgi:hypothetical protein
MTAQVEGKVTRQRKERDEEEKGGQDRPAKLREEDFEGSLNIESGNDRFPQKYTFRITGSQRLDFLRLLKYNVSNSADDVAKRLTEGFDEMLQLRVAEQSFPKNPAPS